MSSPRPLSQHLLPFAIPLAVVSVAAMGLVLPFVVASTVGSNEQVVSASLPPLEVKQVVHGRELYASTCFACHAADAKGVANLGKDLTAGYSRQSGDGELIAMIMRGRQPGEPGHTAAVPMPPKGGRADLTRSDVADVVAYLRSLQDPSRLSEPLPEPVAAAEPEATPVAAQPVAAAPVSAEKLAVAESGFAVASSASAETFTFNAEAAQRGKKVFNSCIACHGKNGTGVANLGADLVHSSFVSTKSDQELIAFIKKGRLPTDPETKMKLNMPPKGGNPALNDKQLADVVAYLRSLHATQSALR